MCDRMWDSALKIAKGYYVDGGEKILATHIKDKWKGQYCHPHSLHTFLLKPVFAQYLKALRVKALLLPLQDYCGTWVNKMYSLPLGRSPSGTYATHHLVEFTGSLSIHSFTQCKLTSPLGGSTTLGWLKLGGLFLGLFCLICVTVYFNGSQIMGIGIYLGFLWVLSFYSPSFIVTSHCS